MPRAEQSEAKAGGEPSSWHLGCMVDARLELGGMLGRNDSCQQGRIGGKVVAELQRKGTVTERLRHFYLLCRRRYPLPMQLVQFCAIGASGVVVDLGMVHLVYHGVARSMPVARFAGIAVAMVWNFWLNRHVTFRESRSAPVLPQFARFAAACSLGAALNWLISIGLFLHAPWFAGRVARCALAGVVAATGSNFLLSKYFAFRHRKCAAVPMAMESPGADLHRPSA